MRYQHVQGKAYVKPRLRQTDKLAAQTPRFIVLKATLPEHQRLESDPLEIWFVFDREKNDWAETAPSKSRFYAESESALAFERATELNALESQLRLSGESNKTTIN